MHAQPIGVFDSGIGGLTVLKAIHQLLPNEPLLYLGDTARVPYGSRGTDTILQFSLQLTNYLLGHHVKLVVVACNTISAVALAEIHSLSPVPVVDVISSSAAAIMSHTKTRSVGILGTPATIQSGAYQQVLLAHDSRLRIRARACPLFVPLVENGMAQSAISRQVVHYYLHDFAAADMDVIHLGCTHYPLLAQDIQAVVGKRVRLIDSAYPTAIAVKEQLREKKLVSPTSSPVPPVICLTDASAQTQEVISLFLGPPVSYQLRMAALPSSA